MFASHTTGTVSLAEPDGTVNVVTVQKLNWKRLQDAGEAQSDRAMAKAAKAGPDVITFWERQAKQESDSGKSKPEPTVEEQREARYRAYDKETVLLYGVRAWTSSVNLAEGLGDLDDESSEKLHRKVLDMSLPPLTKVEVEALKGEG